MKREKRFVVYIVRRRGRRDYETSALVSNLRDPVLYCFLGNSDLCFTSVIERSPVHRERTSSVQSDSQAVRQ